MTFIFKTLLLFLIVNNTHQPFCSSKLISDSVAKRDTIIQREVVIINRKKYTAINSLNDSSEKRFYIKDQKGKTIYTYKDGGILSFKFVDFNNDGYKDVVVDLRGVDSGQQDLIIYDEKSKAFKLAGNCSNARKIPTTKYYYSYEDCCMGRAWSSNLFYISKSKIINIGHIKYNDGYGLSFFKFNGKNKILLKKWKVRINGDTPVTTGPHIDFDLGNYWRYHLHLLNN